MQAPGCDSQRCRKRSDTEARHRSITSQKDAARYRFRARLGFVKGLLLGGDSFFHADFHFFLP
jgi:hypothetical protein